MQRLVSVRSVPLHVVRGSLILVSLAFGACGDDELVTLAGDDLGRDASGDTGTGGSSGGTGGSGGSSGGQSDGALDSASGGSAGDAGLAGAGGSAGDGSNGCVAGAEYKLDVCLRLTRPGDILETLVPAYFGSVHNDCRVARLVDEHPNVGDFANLLTPWSLELWGCRENGASSFALVDEVTDVSAADAALLIDLYMAVATLRLALSTEEEAEMRRALECLSAQAISDPSTTRHALSKCTDAGSEPPEDSGSDAGGEGGTDDGGDLDGQAEAG
jgi:hypothetical protein